MEHSYLTLSNNTAALPDTEQELAILFLDIRNFTGLMESQTEQTVIEVVRRLFTAFNQVIRKFEGKVVDMAGDSMYAVFGLQTGLKEAVNNAYQAAKVMFRTVTLFNEAHEGPYDGGPLEIGVGLHAGKVFVGEFALGDDAPRLTVMGLPVNIASRLQAKTKELNNDLIISEDAWQLLSTPQSLTQHQTVKLQGIASEQPIRLAGKPYGNPHQHSPELDYLLAISG